MGKRVKKRRSNLPFVRNSSRQARFHLLYDISLLIFGPFESARDSSVQSESFMFEQIESYQPITITIRAPYLQLVSNDGSAPFSMPLPSHDSLFLPLFEKYDFFIVFHRRSHSDI